MPIYEYRCTRCGHQFEVTHAVGDTVTRCERCGGGVRRVYSPVGIIFKGSGFHVTDYRKAPAEGDGKAAGDGKASGAGTKPTSADGGSERTAASSGSSTRTKST